MVNETPRRVGKRTIVQHLRTVNDRLIVVDAEWREPSAREATIARVETVGRTTYYRMYEPEK